MSNYHLAEVNIARMLYPLDDPRMHGFVSQLEAINALADDSEGFIWRLQDDSGDATSYRFFDDDMLIVNLSVWKDVDSLYQYTYYSDHAKVFRQRSDWFEMMAEHHMALWWVQAGHIPSVEEAIEKITHLRQQGATSEAFTFKTRFDAPE